MSSLLCTTPTMPLGVIATTNTSDDVHTHSNNHGSKKSRGNHSHGHGHESSNKSNSNIENGQRRPKMQFYFHNSNNDTDNKKNKGGMSMANSLTSFSGACHQFEGSSSASTARLLQSIEGCHQLGPLSSLAKKQIARQRKVSFVPQNDQVVTIPRVSDLTPEEFKAVYMTRGEMGAIHEECWRLVDLMNQGVEWEDTPGFSKRGLVDLKDVCVERRRAMRDQAYKIVFGVQKFHGGSIVAKGGGIRRPTDCVDVIDVTATLYSKAAARAQEEAYESAWFDSIAARV
mmetsp:Transcript_57050/g.138999  ORF Transcript_57050/g.138999 Transcript_57050/m.138999 type:complete len:286 (+) Transcript_57050:94-951(+)